MPNPKSHRNIILETAAGLFLEKGYHATSIGDIARAAGVPKGSIYNHFASKDELAAASVQSEWARMDALEAELTERTLSARELTVLLLERDRSYMESVEFRVGDSIGARVNEVTYQDAPNLHTMAAALHRNFQEILAGVILRYWKVHAAPYVESDAHDLAMIISAMRHGAMLLAKVERSGQPIQSVSNRIAELLRRYD